MPSVIGSAVCALGERASDAGGAFALIGDADDL
jgi:hypothetical protein